MSQSRRRRALGAGVVSVGMVAAVAITTAPAMGAPQYTRIDQSSMTAVAADSVENSGEGANGPTASPTTGTTCQINALEYTARQNAANGRAKGYQVFASRDAKTWGDPVASGDFADVTTPQVVEFTKPVPGPFVKLVETSSQNGAQFGGAGEIRLSASCSGPVAPTVTAAQTPTATPVPTVTPTPTVAPTTAPTSAKPSDSASPSHPGT